MRLAAFYAAVCLAALIGLAAVRLGWQPDFIAVWDARSRQILNWFFLIPILIGAVGLSETLPKFELPKRLTAVPSATTVLLPIVLVLGLLELSPDSSGAEILMALFKWGCAAIFISVVTGIAQSFESKPEPIDSPDTRSRHAFLVGAIAVVLIGGVLLLSEVRARDDGGYEEFARLGEPDLHLAVGVRTAPLWGDSYAVLRIYGAQDGNGLVLEHDEWPAVAELWTKARQMRSTGWQVAGETHDTVMSDSTTLRVSGGPGVRLRMSSPHSPTMTYEVAPADIPRLDAAISKTGQRLGQ